MAAVPQQRGKQIVLAMLAVICGVLVYRNFISAARERTPSSVSTTAAAAGNPGARPRDAAARLLQSELGRHDKIIDPRDLASLDPTLRLDLLKKTRSVEYESGGRNIFQFYTPPPKPVTNPLIATPGGIQTPSAAAPPPPPTIPLKFYGMATRPGSSERKAFLTDGEEIFIGQEGEIVAKRYKIKRVGVNSLEWEDTQTHQQGQLPLTEE